MWHECEKRKVHSKFWWEYIKARDYLEDIEIPRKRNTLYERGWI
jgi:hypothetical protein